MAAAGDVFMRSPFEKPPRQARERTSQEMEDDGAPMAHVNREMNKAINESQLRALSELSERQRSEDIDIA
jgi:hypothetical protein